MSDHEQTGLLASLRRMAETALGTVQNRVELFALEIQEEKCWLVSTLLWTAAAIFFSGIAILLVVGTVVYFTPEVARPWVLSGFTMIFIYLSINAIIGMRRSLHHKRPPLSDTIGELKKDIDWIRSQD